MMFKLDDKEFSALPAKNKLKYNVFVAGKPGSGKSVFIGANNLIDLDEARTLSLNVFANQGPNREKVNCEKD